MRDLQLTLQENRVASLDRVETAGETYSQKVVLDVVVHVH